MNHNRRTALERSVKITVGLKPVLRDHNLALALCVILELKVGTCAFFKSLSIEKKILRGFYVKPNMNIRDVCQLLKCMDRHQFFYQRQTFRCLKTLAPQGQAILRISLSYTNFVFCLD